SGSRSVHCTTDIDGSLTPTYLQNPMQKPLTPISTGCLIAITLTAECVSPLSRTLEQELHEQLILSQKAYREAIAAGPVIELSRPESQVEKFLTEKNLLEQADRLGGPSSYQGVELETGRDLMGDSKTKSVSMTLQRAI